MNSGSLEVDGAHVYMREVSVQEGVASLSNSTWLEVDGAHVYMRGSCEALPLNELYLARG